MRKRYLIEGRSKDDRTIALTVETTSFVEAANEFLSKDEEGVILRITLTAYEIDGRWFNIKF